MILEDNLTPKVTVVVSTPDVGQAPMPEAAPARVKMFNSTAEPAESLVLEETGTMLPVSEM
jgi:hypothetical protein